MINKIKKKFTYIDLISLFFSVAYGFFVLSALQRLYTSDSGDIAALLDFFNNIDIFVLNNNYAVITGDGLFRLLVVFLGTYYQIEYIAVLGGIAFVTSAISFRICTINIRSSTYLIYFLPLLIMLFTSPNIVNLYASGVRSGIAFTILLLAFLQSNSIIKYLLFFFSSMFHLSMVPIISFYFLFRILQSKRINASKMASYFLLTIYSFSIATFAYLYQYNVTTVSSSFYFNLLTFYVALLLVLLSKKSIKNVYGFMSIGVILIVVAGIFLNVSFSRYVGNALIFFLLFLIQEPNPNVIRIFSLGYSPFFLLTLFYSISNQL